MAEWRVIRTIVRGQFANDDCFLKWIGSHPAEIAIAKVVAMPAISELAVPYKDTFATLYPFLKPEDFGSSKPNANDQQLYIVYQAAAVATPNCPNGNPSLVTRNGRNGWDTQAEAQAVVDAELNQRNAIAAQVKAANEKAVSPSNVLKGLLNDLPDVPDPTKPLGGLIWGVAIVGGAFVLWKVLK